MFHVDKLGSVVAMSNAGNGQLATNGGPYLYDAYGNCFTSGSPCSTAGTPYLFTGQRFDPETGLYYYRARCYSPSLGRFCQTDPVGYEDDLNWYDYVGDDPTDKTDPTGKCVPCVVAIVIKATNGAISGGVGGYITGGWKGATVGAGVGAVIGATVPNPVAGAALASVAGQLAGKVTDNHSNGKPTLANLTIDGLAVAGATLGSKGVSGFKEAAERTIGVGRGSVLGKEVGKESLDKSVGQTVGSTIDGGGSGVGELLGQLGTKISNLPTIVRITDSHGNFAPDIESESQEKAKEADPKSLEQKTSQSGKKF